MSAPIICATLAANLSLSPYLISDVATVSFSLIIGIYLFLSNSSKVALAFKYLLLFSVSSAVISICAISIPLFFNALSQPLINLICPIDEAAWLSESDSFFLLFLFQY